MTTQTAAVRSKNKNGVIDEITTLAKKSRSSLPGSFEVPNTRWNMQSGVRTVIGSRARYSQALSPLIPRFDCKFFAKKGIRPITCI